MRTPRKHETSRATGVVLATALTNVTHKIRGHCQGTFLLLHRRLPCKASGPSWAGIAEMRLVRQILLLALALVVVDVQCINVLVVHTEDDARQNEQLAKAVGAGVLEADASYGVRVVSVDAANYERDVLQWADAIALGSSVDNGNVVPELLSFIDSFDIMEEALSRKVATSFATGGSAASGLQPVLEQINRALLTFRFVITGGDSWESSEGTGAVTNGTAPVADKWLTLARAHGKRLAWLASVVKSGPGRTPPPPPPPSPPPSPPFTPPSPGRPTDEPPGFGARWTAKISANLTQVGYDAGLVIVNFSTACGASPATQRSKTVYGDFYTVLTRCDLGYEFTLAPASRGGGCTVRRVGVDVAARVCAACGCPFCVRDTNGTYSHGEHRGATTAWQKPARAVIDGESLNVWRGTATSQGGEHYALSTGLAFTLDGTPRFVNVSHPLWIQTAARVDGFERSVPDDAFDVPPSCFAPRTAAARDLL